MEAPIKYIYIKFKIDKRINKMNGFIISEERATVDSWKADKETDPKEPPSTTAADERSFDGIAEDFSKSIEVFRRTVPFVMQTLPVLRSLHDDDLIRSFVKQHGAPLGNGEFETYQISIDYAGELNRRLDNAIAVGDGVKNLPAMFLVGLISAYDAFLAQTIRAMFLAQPGLLSSSDRNISFKDLTEIGSIDAARDKIIEKEVETILRENHADQIKWIESKLSIPLRKDLKVWPDFIELCERRNLLTHTGGAISSQYLDVRKSHGCDISKYAVGQVIFIEPKYYRRAVQIIFEMGSKLVQVMWRKLIPNDIEAADKALNNLGYELIVKRMYGLAATMLRFGLYEMKKHGSEAVRKQMVVNYANSEKLSGNKEAAIEILDDEDWTASTDNYKICVAAVKDDLDTVIRLMKPVVDAELLSVSHFREWPVFETVRSDARFVETFEREFGQKLLADKEVTNLQQLGRAESIDGGSQERDESNNQESEISTVH